MNHFRGILVCCSGLNCQQCTKSLLYLIKDWVQIIAAFKNETKRSLIVLPTHSTPVACVPSKFDKKDSHSFIYKNKIMISESNCQQHGNAAHCTYDSQVKIHDGSTMVVFNDAWFYMIDENHIIGNIKVKKFGITLADIILQIEK